MAVVSGDTFNAQPTPTSVPAPRDGPARWSVINPGATVSSAASTDSARCSRSEARPLQVVASRPNPESVVLYARGDIAETNAHRLKELLLARVRSCVTTVVLDMTAVSFLGVAGLEVLGTMKQCAALNHTRLVLVTESNPAVLRPLRAAAIAGAQVLAETHREA